LHFSAMTVLSGALLEGVVDRLTRREVDGRGLGLPGA